MISTYRCHQGTQCFFYRKRQNKVRPSEIASATLTEKCLKGLFIHENQYVKLPAHLPQHSSSLKGAGEKERERYKIEIGNKKKERFKGRWRGKCDTDKWEEDEEDGLCVHGADGGVG